MAPSRTIPARGTRCWWCGSDPVYVRYHDREWGVPVTGDRALWEKLVLDGFQAGLSWITILRKRPAFRRAFAGFDPSAVARFGARDVARLLQDDGIVRSRAKIEAAIANARAWERVMEAGGRGAFRDLLWGHEDPLFPATRVELGPQLQFEAVGVERKAWSSAAPIRAIFKAAFAAAGLPYYNPHSLRSTLVLFGQTVCQTPEDFKAWSQNLGHEGVLTTFYSYGTVAPRRQGEIIKELASPTGRLADTADNLAEAVLRAMRKEGLKIG